MKCSIKRKKTIRKKLKANKFVSYLKLLNPDASFALKKGNLSTIYTTLEPDELANLVLPEGAVFSEDPSDSIGYGCVYVQYKENEYALYKKSCSHVFS